MKKNVEIIVLLDKSGSMTSIQESTISGFNLFVSQQKELNPEAKLSLIQFDHEYEVNYESLNIMHVKELNMDTYVPRGSTALFDAMGRTMVKFKDKIDKETKVIFTIITDGYENRSVEFNRENINRLTSEMKQNYNWEIVYMGANQDAISEAGKFGISKSNALTFDASDSGMTSAFVSLSNATKMCLEQNEFSFNSSDREEQNRIMDWD